MRHGRKATPTLGLITFAAEFSAKWEKAFPEIDRER
jgi:hypothetical protein